LFQHAPTVVGETGPKQVPDLPQYVCAPLGPRPCRDKPQTAKPGETTHAFAKSTTSVGACQIKLSSCNKSTRPRSCHRGCKLDLRGHGNSVICSRNGIHAPHLRPLHDRRYAYLSTLNIFRRHTQLITSYHKFNTPRFLAPSSFLQIPSRVVIFTIPKHLLPSQLVLWLAANGV
jgi:hypothetical protein